MCKYCHTQLYVVKPLSFLLFFFFLSQSFSTNQAPPVLLHLSKDDREGERDTWLYPAKQTIFPHCDLAAVCQSHPQRQAKVCSRVHTLKILHMQWPPAQTVKTLC